MPRCLVCKTKNELIESLKDQIESLKDQIQFFRNDNKILSDRLVAICDKPAFQALGFGQPASTGEHYGDGHNEQYVGYDQWGQEIRLEKESKAFGEL